MFDITLFHNNVIEPTKNGKTCSFYPAYFTNLHIFQTKILFLLAAVVFSDGINDFSCVSVSLYTADTVGKHTSKKYFNNYHVSATYQRLLLKIICYF